jgi:protein SCO1/2
VGPIALAVTIAGLAACRPRRAERPDPRAALASPSGAGQVEIEEHLGARVPAALRFTDEEGAEISVADLLRPGKPIVLVLAYLRCPMLCDLVQRGVATAVRASGLAAGDDVRMVTVSIDPRDTRGEARLRRQGLLGALGDAPPAAWRVLTGDEASIRSLADAFGFRYVYDPVSRQYAHPACAFVLTPDGRISRYLYGTTFRPFDMRMAVVEAAAGRVGSIVDRVILTCFRYDPSARRYGVYVLGVMRGGSAVVLLSFALGLAIMVRRDRSRRGPRGGGR